MAIFNSYFDITRGYGSLLKRTSPFSFRKSTSFGASNESSWLCFLKGLETDSIWRHATPHSIHPYLSTHMYVYIYILYTHHQSSSLLLLQYELCLFIFIVSSNYVSCPTTINWYFWRAEMFATKSVLLLFLFQPKAYQAMLTFTIKLAFYKRPAFCVA